MNLTICDRLILNKSNFPNDEFYDETCTPDIRKHDRVYQFRLEGYNVLPLNHFIPLVERPFNASEKEVATVNIINYSFIQSNGKIYTTGCYIINTSIDKPSLPSFVN